MEFVRQVLVFLHLLGMAMLVAAFLLQRRAGMTGPLNKAFEHAAGLQLITGLALVGLTEASDRDVNHIKIGVKLLVVLVILVLALVYRKKQSVPAWLAPTLGGLTVLNVGVAVFW